MPWPKGLHGPAIDRFWCCVVVGDSWHLRTRTPCWRWTGWTNAGGYGYFSADGRRHVPAHRFAYETFVGSVPEGLETDHLCRNRWCVNPDHLEPVTRSENTRRGIGPKLVKERMAARTHCGRGHPLTAERPCRECRKVNDRERYQRTAAEQRNRYRELRAQGLTVEEAANRRRSG